MDLPPEELQFLSIRDILKESISIPKQSPKTFYLITLTLIFPLSFAILAHSLFTHPLLTQINTSPASSHSSQWTKLLIFQFCYLIFLFAFSLLSTAAVVFTVASLYTSKPVSFSSTLAAIPNVFRRLFITYLWVSLIMIVYNVVFVSFLVLLFIAADTQNPALFFFAMIVIALLYLVVHVYITALWHLASVVSVLEPLYGFRAMRKSYELLKGRTRMAAVLVFAYLAICGVVINWIFGAVVVHGGEDYGVFVRIAVGGFLVGVLVIVNLVGLMVQSVFTMFARATTTRGLTRVLCMTILEVILGNMFLSRATFRWKTWMVETMVSRFVVVGLILICFAYCVALPGKQAGRTRESSNRAGVQEVNAHNCMKEKLEPQSSEEPV